MNRIKFFVMTLAFCLLFSFPAFAVTYDSGVVTEDNAAGSFTCYVGSDSSNATYYTFFANYNDVSDDTYTFVVLGDTNVTLYFFAADNFTYNKSEYYTYSGALVSDSTNVSASVSKAAAWSGFYYGTTSLGSSALSFVSATVPTFSSLNDAADFFFKGGTDLDGNTYSEYYSDDLSTGDDDSGVLSWLGNLFSSLSAWFANLIDAISQGFSSLLDGICDFFKSLFIPEDGYIEDCCSQISDMFDVTFGVGDFDLQNIVADEKPLQDIDSSFTIFGIQFSETFVNFDFVINALATFRPYIRGFIALLLILFSINQILLLIGQAPLSVQGLSEIREAASRSEREPIGFKGPNS